MYAPGMAPLYQSTQGQEFAQRAPILVPPTLIEQTAQTSTRPSYRQMRTPVTIIPVRQQVYVPVYQMVPVETRRRDIYTAVVEGRVVGSFSTLDEATQAAMQAAKPGDRMEILVNGQSTGVHLRTSDSSSEVAKAQESAVKTLPASEVKAAVAEAEKAAEKPSGGSSLPLLIIGALMAFGQ